MTARTQVITRVMILSILFEAVVGCAPANTQSPATEPSAATLPPASTATLPTATLPAGWETYTIQGQCGYAIDHPSDMEGTSHGTYSWSLRVSTTDPSGPSTNFVYVSVIPDGFQNEPGAIYNYDPAATETLLRMQAGESRPLYDDPNLANFAPSFTYTRLPDRTLSNQSAQAYENTQPLEFPPGTKEIRYYLKANGCTYLVGGYMATEGSGQPGSIDEELFDQIIATFRLAL
jgi:hypothetical protein